MSGYATYFCVECSLEIDDDVCPHCGTECTWVSLVSDDGMTSRMPLQLYNRIRSRPGLAEKVRYTGDVEYKR